MIKILRESLFHTTKTANSDDRLRKISDASQIPNENFYKFGKSYFDGGIGSLSYGAYKYDGRYKASVNKLIDQFHLNKCSSVLEFGCAKGYILYEFYKFGFNDLLGIDISEYAISNSPKELHDKLRIANVINFDSIIEQQKKFNFIFSKEMLPHLTKEEINIFFGHLPKIANHESIIYFEIQTARDSAGLEAIEKYDPTHKSLMTPIEWIQFFNKNIIGIDAKILIYLKELF